MGGCCGAMKSSHKSMPEKDKQPQSKSNTLTRNSESKVKSDKKVEANGKTPKKDQEEKVEEKQQESTDLAGDAKEVKLINPFESDEKPEDNPVTNGPSAVGVSVEEKIESQESKVVSDDDLVVKAGEIVEETIRKSVQEECSSAKPVVEVIELEKQKDETAEAPVAEVVEEKVPAIVMETFPGDAEQKEEAVNVPVVEVIEKEVSTNVTETMPVNVAEEKILEVQEFPEEQKAEDSKRVDEPVQESQPQTMPEEFKEVEKALSETAVPELCPEPCQTNVLESEVVEVKKHEEKQEQPLHSETCESNNAEDVQVPEVEVAKPLAEVPSSEMTDRIIDEKVEVQNSESADFSETQEMKTTPQQQPDAQVPEKLSDSEEKCCQDKEVEPVAEEVLQEKQAEALPCEQKMSEEPATQNVEEPKEHLPVEVEDVVPEPMMCVVEESSLGETVQLDIAQPCLLAPQLEEQVPVEKSETDQELNEEKPIANTNDSNVVQPEVASETEVLTNNSEANEKLSKENAVINTDVKPEDIPESLKETSKLAEADDKSQGPETVAVEELSEEIKATETETQETILTQSHPCQQTPDIEKEDLSEVSQPETCQVAEQQVLQVETQADEVTLQANQSNEVNQPKEETEAPVSLPNEQETTRDEVCIETPMAQQEETSMTVAETEESVESENNVQSKAQVSVEGVEDVEQYSNQLVKETVENVLSELTVSVCSEKELKQEEINTNSEKTEVSETEVPVEEKCESSCEKAEVQEIKTTLESSSTLPQEESQDDVDDAENLPPPPAPEELMFPPNVSQSEGSMPSSQDSLSLPSPPGDLNCENAVDVEPQIENHCPTVEAESLPCVELKSDITCECSATETEVEESLPEESLLQESSKSANSSEKKE